MELSLTLKALPAAYLWQLDPASPGTQSLGCQQHQLQGPAVQAIMLGTWLTAPKRRGTIGMTLVLRQAPHLCNLSRIKVAWRVC